MALRRRGMASRLWELQCNFSFSCQNLYSVRRHSVETSRYQGVAAGGVATHRDMASLIFGTAVQLFFLMCTSVRRHSVEASRCQGVVAGGIATHRDTASQFLELQCKLSFSCQNLYNIGNTSVLRHSVKASRRQGVAAGGFATHCDTASRFFWNCSATFLSRAKMCITFERGIRENGKVCQTFQDKTKHLCVSAFQNLSNFGISL